MFNGLNSRQYGHRMNQSDNSVFSCHSEAEYYSTCAFGIGAYLGSLLVSNLIITSQYSSSIGIVVGGIGGLLIGRLVDRWSSRPVKGSQPG